VIQPILWLRLSPSNAHAVQGWLFVNVSARRSLALGHWFTTNSYGVYHADDRYGLRVVLW
jgi:hypothetical protein